MSQRINFSCKMVILINKKSVYIYIYISMCVYVYIEIVTIFIFIDKFEILFDIFVLKCINIYTL